MHTNLLGITLALSFATAVGLVGCSSSDSSTPTPAEQDSGVGGSSGAAGSGGSAADAAPEAEASVEQDAQPSDSLPPGLKVKVTYLGATTEVDLNQPPVFQNGGFGYSLVSDVIGIAVPGKPIANLQAGFVAGDGYNPADKSGCASFVPVAGSNLSKGWIDRATRFLAWDTSLGLPGCMQIKDLAEILVTDK